VAQFTLPEEFSVFTDRSVENADDFLEFWLKRKILNDVGHRNPVTSIVLSLLQFYWGRRSK